jgi:meso-butanediol dehydrogenase/(S,S)-butanediol dehydrogenase/diacetyl reductase
VNLTRNLAVDHAHEGVRANCVCPGGVGTPMLKAHMRSARPCATSPKATST